MFALLGLGTAITAGKYVGHRYFPYLQAAQVAGNLFLATGCVVGFLTGVLYAREFALLGGLQFITMAFHGVTFFRYRGFSLSESGRAG